MSNFTRRDFAKTTLLSVGGILLFPGCAIKEEDASYHFFTNMEAKCIIALCEQIIPADNNPGATQAEVIYYIDRQLTDYYKSDQGMYRKGIAAIQASCNKLNGKLFEDLNFNEQRSFLKKMEKSKLPKEEWGEIDQASFFWNTKSQTKEGFYSLPIHGGNKDHVSFKIMKIEHPYSFGQNR